MKPDSFRPAFILSLAFVIVGLSASAGAAADDRVYEDAKSTRPLQPGAKVPSASIRSVEGQVVDIADLTRESGALLVFYRGGW